MCRIAETRNSELDIIGICLCCLDKIMKYGRIESVTPLQRAFIIDFGFRHNQVFYWIEIKNKNKSSTQFIRGFISGLFFSSIIAFISGLIIVLFDCEGHWHKWTEHYVEMTGPSIAIGVVFTQGTMRCL